ncbi:hypothetical protein AX15_003710 [Amanita polypyramis BW_CC]|nr:hypothetical protein AX15_003710 [Amanita polypyramis BW_CC]
MPTYIARAPGRVNLIGEHIDYSLFGVLPAAIERDILVACAPQDIMPYHSTSSQHTLEVFAPEPKNAGAGAHGWHLDINTKELKWESYVKAAYYGVLEQFFAEGIKDPIVPVDMLFMGTVPAGSGLSSSAAMVVASSLAFLAVNGKLDQHVNDIENPRHGLTKGELVRMTVENERRVGVNSGGQLIGRFLGEEGDLDVEQLQDSLENACKDINILKPKAYRDTEDADDVQLGVTLEEMIEMSGLSRDIFYEAYLSWVEDERLHGILINTNDCL